MSTTPEAPQSRNELWLNAIAGLLGGAIYSVLPESPQSRVEKWLAYIAELLQGGQSISAGDVTYDPTTTYPNGSVGAALQNKEEKSVSESITIASSAWTALSGAGIFTKSATVAATHTIGSDTTTELINDNATLFGTYGFAIGAPPVGQNITFFALSAPENDVTLEVKFHA